MFIRYTFSRFIESNTNFKNQSNFSLFIHIYEHKKQLLKTMFNICSTSSNMWIWSYDHDLKIVLPAAPWMRSMTGLPQVRHFTPPPPHFTPPTWTCWARHIKSVDGFVFFRLCYFCGRFFGYISWQMLKIAFWSFQILKFSREDTPIPPYKARAFGTRDNVPPSPFPPLLQRI